MKGALPLGFTLVMLCGSLAMLATGQILGGSVLAAFTLSAAFFSALRRSRSASSSDPTQGLSLDSQARLRPFLRLRDEIRGIVERHADHPAIQVIGTEAVAEAESMVERLSVLLRSRSEAAKAALGPRPRKALETFDVQVADAFRELQALRDDLTNHLAQNLAEDDSIRHRLGQIQSLRTSLDESRDLFGSQP